MASSEPSILVSSMSNRLLYASLLRTGRNCITNASLKQAAAVYTTAADRNRVKKHTQSKTDWIPAHRAETLYAMSRWRKLYIA